MISKFYTEKFLDDSRMLANDILLPNSKNHSLEKTVHHHHSHTHWGSPFWGSWGYYPQPVYIGTPCGTQRQKEENRWMAIPVAIAALAMLFPAAQNWAEWNMANRKILNLRETMEGVRLEIENSPRDVQNAVREVLNRQTALLDHMRKEARNGFFLKGILIGSLAGGTLSIAGLVTSAALPIVCGVTAITSITAMIWRSGIRSIDNETQTRAKELSISTERASRILHWWYA